MGSDSLILDTSAVDAYEITLAVRGNTIQITAPVGQPLDVTWCALSRAALAYQCEMTAQRVLERQRTHLPGRSS